MHVERTLALADLISGLEHADPNKPANGEGKFNMTRYAFPCGSPACIAGYAAAMAQKDAEYDYKAERTEYAAARYLELTSKEASDLFVPEGYTFGDGITPEGAATVLRKFVETGIVDWEQLPRQWAAWG